MLLKVQCENCKTKYKLDESRIQGKGAKITCPKCRHVFVVLREAASEADDAGSEPEESEESPTVVTAPGSGLIPGTVESLSPPPPEEPELARPKTAEELSWKEVGLNAFKVKVAIGLIYDFSDVQTLRKYIAEKRVVPTDRLSIDGKTWFTIKDIPNLDGFFIDQWMELKKERLKSGGGGVPPGPGGPTFGSGKSPRTAGRDSDTGKPVKKTAWSSDAAPESAGGFGEDLFRGLDLPEADSNSTLNRQARGGDARTTGGPPSELRSPGPTSTALLKDVARTIPAPPPPQARGLRAGELLTLALLLAASGYLGWQLVREAQAAPNVPTVDSAAERQALDTLMREHFPLSLAPAAGAGEQGATPTGNPPGDATSDPEGTTPKSTATPDGARPGDSAAGAVPSAGGPDKGRKGEEASRKGQKGKSTVSVGAITAADLFILGQESLRGRDYAGAVQSLQTAVEMKPQHPDYVYLLGYAQVLAGQNKDAEASLKRSLSLGKHPEAHKWLGEIYARRGEKQRAIDALQKYLESGPSDSAAIKSRIEQLSKS